MNEPLHVVPFAIKRIAVRAHRRRSHQIKTVEALMYLRERKLQPKVPNYAFFSTLPSSYREATGYDIKTMDEQKWERIAHKAFKLFLA